MLQQLLILLMIRAKSSIKMMKEKFKINETLAGSRLDKALSTLCPDLSRTRIKVLIEAGMVAVNGGEVLSASFKVNALDVLSIVVPAPVDDRPSPQNIALDIVYEDDDLLVINKAADMVVHPGAGNPDGTLVNALLHHCRDNLSGIGGVKRPGIVHRLDKETSGLIVVAKNDFAHQGLSAQLADRSLSRIYKALVWRVPNLIKGSIDAPIGRHKTNRLKMAIQFSSGREAVTHYHLEEAIEQAMAWVTCTLESGRTHQIRVHMQHIKHPLVGDPVYGLSRQDGGVLLNKAGFAPEIRDQILDFPRQVLHAGEIGFIHPRTDEEMRFEVPFPDDIQNLKTLINS